jgi:DNA-binding beta-propeller fold protein YncE
MWVSQRNGTGVVRLDPGTGDVLATIDIGDSPVKLQPAGGRMWVRAGEAYVAIDPATNTVVATLAKSDVGPQANRSWAVDGAMWICDGQRLHRYDPTTVRPVAVVELGIDCGQVFATDDLVVAWTYNEDEGESGTSAAAFIDPATNQRIATVNLPVDVGVPVVLDGAVFFAGYAGSTAVVIDRATWSVAATPDLGRPTGGSLVATDGEQIFVPTYHAAGPRDVLVVDAAAFTVMDTIESLGNNSVAVLDGALWTADAHFDVVQRHDI